MAHRSRDLGDEMPAGRFIIAVLALSLAGCANETQTSALSLTPLSSGPAMAAKREVKASEADVEARLAAKQTLAGRVLAAIALERVTGRKPDPARFAQLNN